ncbi:HK97 family phage prohead protease [Nocardiopsis synnemataformans]|uniref:HK97 family phage prohead protease n=1 Tax=Nocardiopsis synnemataformans TaxID=61305 RepID=UPI003EBE6341
MNRGYVRAHLERAEEGKPLRFVAATEGRKGDGIDLRMSGARLERFRANPVIGYNHSYWGRQSLPIGRAPTVETDGNRLMMDIEFDPDDEFAMEVERKYRGGFLNAVSIGFDVNEWENEADNYWRGGVATDWELLETSAVPIPMDASAVVESGRGLRSDWANLVASLPPDLGVRVLRNAEQLTRSVEVTEELIRQADPVTLAAAIARSLAMGPLTKAPVEDVSEGPTPEALTAALAERDDYAERLHVAHSQLAAIKAERDVHAQKLEELQAAQSVPAFDPADAAALLGAFG